MPDIYLKKGENPTAPRLILAGVSSLWQSLKIKRRLLLLQALVFAARMLLKMEKKKNAYALIIVGRIPRLAGMNVQNDYKIPRGGSIERIAENPPTHINLKEIPRAFSPRKFMRQERDIQRADLSFSSFFAKMARAFALFSLIILLVSFAPSLYYVATYTLYGDKTPQLLAQTAESSKDLDQKKVKGKIYQPKFDPALLVEGRLVVPAIGVDTQIQEATYDNYEEALKRGVWRVSDFGTPFARERPIILAAHRYGYLRWSNLFRRKNSFYNLPKLAPGDVVEISWRQRKYLFEVYAEEKGDKITNYAADLILYTCESLNSPVRIIKYARLLEI